MGIKNYYKNSLLIHYEQKAGNALILGDYKSSIDNYNKLISLRPDVSVYYYFRGDAYKGDKQYAKAILDYLMSLKIGISSDDSLQTMLRIALIYKVEGMVNNEEKMLNELLRLSKNRIGNENEYWAANYHLGQLEYKKKHYRKAINYYNTAHLTSPTNLEIYHRANSYFALGKIDSARLDLRQSIKFVKSDYVDKNPNSILAQCDTCSFPFGSKEYELLTEENESILEILDKFSRDKKSDR